VCVDRARACMADGKRTWPGQGQAGPCAFRLQCQPLWSMIVAAAAKTPSLTMATKTRAASEARHGGNAPESLPSVANTCSVAARPGPARPCRGAGRHRSRNDRPACHSSLPVGPGRGPARCPPPPSFHRVTWARRAEVSPGRSAWKRRATRVMARAIYSGVASRWSSPKQTIVWRRAEPLGAGGRGVVLSLRRSTALLLADTQQRRPLCSSLRPKSAVYAPGRPDEPLSLRMRAFLSSSFALFFYGGSSSTAQRAGPVDCHCSAYTTTPCFILNLPNRRPTRCRICPVHSVINDDS